MTDTRIAPPVAVRKRVYPAHGEPLWRRTILTHETMIWAVTAIVAIIAVTSVPHFASPLTLSYLLLDLTPILLCALPVALVLVSGEIDLSVASAVGISNVMLGWLFAHGVPLPVAIAAAILCGAVVGVVNGVLVAVVGLPSLAVTIGTLALFRGIAVGMLGTESVTDFPVQVKLLANSNIPGTGIPLIMVLVLIAIAVFATLLHATPFGRAVFAVGRGPDTARFSGVRTVRLKFTLFLLSGLLAGIAGVFYTFRYGSSRGDNATGLELAVIAGIVLGGVSIFGGRGRIAGVIGGVLLIGIVQSTLRFLNSSDDSINIAVGGLLVASVVLPPVIAQAAQTFASARRHHAVPTGPAESLH
ncbi:ABC transporter permease [Leifsonia sp. F6_8S_P_1B]|uniref:Autoinducer 2 import system permease protein LsrD n=1 Tax=Leifsonia williamsii TaxID=3035919 RepID=A0ABT8K709_9MICO|nr:ABC transporter permease [Leifsonia williamsii]MDN4612817.1 ABC transporter permease [Leifsonia williamsii]